MDFWTLSLAVEADDARRVLTPRVRIEGGTPFAAGVVLVALVDPDERTCGTVHGPLDPEDIGIELRLPPILVPGGVPMERALEWGWDVGVATDGLERIRWRRYLEVGGAANVGDDAEIRLRWPPDGLRSKAEDEGWGPEAPWDARDTDRLLSSLLVHGIITEADRKAVLAEVQARGVTAEQTLVERGHVGERELLERYAEVTGCEILDLDGYPIDPEAVARIPGGMARRYGVIAIGYHGDLLTVAMSFPQHLEAIRAIERVVRIEGIEGIERPYIALATRDDILRALDRVAADDDRVEASLPAASDREKRW